MLLFFSDSLLYRLTVQRQMLNSRYFYARLTLVHKCMQMNRYGQSQRVCDLELSLRFVPTAQRSMKSKYKRINIGIQRLYSEQPLERTDTYQQNGLRLFIMTRLCGQIFISIYRSIALYKNSASRPVNFLLDFSLL